MSEHWDRVLVLSAGLCLFVLELRFSPAGESLGVFGLPLQTALFVACLQYGGLDRSWAESLESAVIAGVLFCALDVFVL